MTVLHAGGKFDNGSYKVSGGLHGVGVSVVNALSEWLKLEIRRERQGLLPGVSPRRSRRREFKQTGVDRSASRHQGHVQARPDDLQHPRVLVRHARAALRELAYLNSGLADRHHRRAHRQDAHDFKFEGGIATFVDDLNENKVDGQRQADLTSADDARTGHRASRSRCSGTTATRENIFCFTNNIKNNDGGTHLTGFRQALTRTVNAYATATSCSRTSKQGLSGDDLSRRADGGRLDQASRSEVLEPAQGQAGLVGGRRASSRAVVNDKLGAVARAASQGGARRSSPSALLAARAREAARKAREMVQRKGALDCRRCRASSPTARSAIRRRPSCSSSRVSRPAARPSRGATRKFQAILPLRGKILNVEKARLDKMLSSQS